MNHHQHTSWDDVKIKAALGRKIRKVAGSKLGPSGVRKLGEVLGRRKPPPGMVPHPEDGDGDGWTDEDDLKKRRYVGYFKPEVIDAPDMMPTGRAQERVRQNGLLERMKNSYMDRFRDRSSRKAFRDRQRRVEPVTGQKAGSSSRSTSKDSIAKSMVEKGQYGRYQPENPYDDFDHVQGIYKDFVESEFKEVDFNQGAGLVRKNPERMAFIISKVLKREKKALDHIFSRKEAYEESSPELLVEAEKRRNQIFGKELPQDSDLEKDRILEQLQEWLDSLTIANSPIHPLDKAFKLVFNELNIRGYNQDWTQALNADEEKALKGLIESAMEQSETFAQLAKIFGLPSMAVMKPQMAGDEVFRKNKLNPNYPDDQITAMRLQENIFRLDDSAGKYNYGNIFIDTLELEENTSWPDRSGSFTVSGSTESILRHEYGHFLDDAGFRELGEFNNATSQQHETLSEGINQLRAEAEKVIEEMLKKDDVQEVIKDLTDLIKSAKRNGFSGYTESKLAADYIKLIASEQFEWLSEYGASDLISISRNGQMQIGTMKEFIAEFLTMATSPNPEVREGIPPRFASIAQSLFAGLGIDWP
jgi:hypothetical protein